MLFVDEVLYKQVTDSAELTVGTFFVDESSDLLSVHFLPSHSTSSKIESSAHSYVFKAQNIHSLVLRNLIFQHGGSVLLDDMGAVHLVECQDVLIENCTIHWNNGNGLTLRGTDRTFGALTTTYGTHNITVRNCELSDNGIAGLETYALENALIENIDSR